MRNTGNKYLPASLTAGLLAGSILFIARMKGPEGILLLDRFIPGIGGWLQISAIGIYAGFISHRLLSAADTSKIRLNIWNLFSIVFFSQFLAGIFISDTFLMSGTLHVPVPALIIADPIYRATSWFMPVLFTSTMLLVGPAWCSYLCYFGSWDGRAASLRSSSQPRNGRLKAMRTTVFLMVIVLALLMRLFHVPVKYATMAAVGFGLAGILIMITVSRKRGLMVHCSSYCPIGLLSNLAGKISPFRIRIDENCLKCMKCSNVCRYDALSAEDMEKGRAGFTCTLCGDCLSSCNRGSIHYHFPGLSQQASRTMFLILVSALHAGFLGIARI
jgi:polyferredoxin